MKLCLDANNSKFVSREPYSPSPSPSAALADNFTQLEHELHSFAGGIDVDCEPLRRKESKRIRVRDKSKRELQDFSWLNSCDDIQGRLMRTSVALAGGHFPSPWQDLPVNECGVRSAPCGMMKMELPAGCQLRCVRLLHECARIFGPCWSLEMKSVLGYSVTVAARAAPRFGIHRRRRRNAT